MAVLVWVTVLVRVGEAGPAVVDVALGVRLGVIVGVTGTVGVLVGVRLGVKVARGVGVEVGNGGIIPLTTEGMYIV